MMTLISLISLCSHLSHMPSAREGGRGRPGAHQGAQAQNHADAGSASLVHLLVQVEWSAPTTFPSSRGGKGIRCLDFSAMRMDRGARV